MAISLNGDYLKRVTGIPDNEAPYTAMMWAQLKTAFADNTIIQFGDALLTASDTIEARNTTQLRARVQAASPTAAYTFAAGTWYHFAMVRESVTSFKCYVNGSLLATVTTDATGRVLPTVFALGQNNGGGAMTACKLWTRALTLSEVGAEVNNRLAVDATDLWAEWPMRDDTVGTYLDDESGAGRDLVRHLGSGTLTFAADPITFDDESTGAVHRVYY